MRICLFLLSGFTVIAGSVCPANTAQADQVVRVIEVITKNYSYTPLPVRVKLGAKVQLKTTSLDKIHGFKIKLHPEGRARKVIRTWSSVAKIEAVDSSRSPI